MDVETNIGLEKWRRGHEDTDMEKWRHGHKDMDKEAWT
jgi:hypothetical protein